MTTMSPDAPTTQTYYDRFAAGYEAERNHGYHRLIDELELELVRKYGAGLDVFEAGCGTGLLLREAATFARSAVGLDLSRGMLGPARDRGLRVVQGSLTDVPLPAASFDLVYSGQSIEHVSEREGDAVVAEVFRVLAPGGWFCLDTPNGPVWRLRSAELMNDDHQIEYSADALSAKLRIGGFEVVESKGLNLMQHGVAGGSFDESEASAHPGVFASADDCLLLAMVARKPTVPTA